MASNSTVLLRKAKKRESKELANIKFTPASVSGLDKLLLDAYTAQCPKPIDYYNRRDLVRIFNVIAKEIYGKTNSSPVVEEYGSFVMDIFSDGSDLDLSINFEDRLAEVPRLKKIETLQKFAKKLKSIQKKGHVRGVQSIMTARVPIVKVMDCGTGIECDLSVDNRDGIVKSKIIFAISAIDGRFQKLSILMKSWAKAHNINSSKDRTLNSLSIVSLVALHLQTRNPPILPPFSALLKEGADPETVTKVSGSYLKYGEKNTESLAELFITLFIKLASVEKLWQKGLCASLYEGSWIYKSWGSRSYSLRVEDFTDRSQNVARAVGTEEVKTIYRCIRESLNYFSDFLNGQMLGTKLIDLLFGTHTVSTLEREDKGHIDENLKDRPILQNQPLPKRRRLMEGLEQKQVQKPSQKNNPVQGLDKMQVQKPSQTNNPVQGLEKKQMQKPSQTNNPVQGLEKKQMQKLSQTNNPAQGWNRAEPRKGSLKGHQADVRRDGTLKESMQKPSQTNYPVQGWQRAEPWKGSVEGHRADVPRGGTFHPPTFRPPAFHPPTFRPPTFHPPTFQPTFLPSAISSSDNMVHHGFRPLTVPSAFALNPLSFERSHNPSLLSHLNSPQNSMGFNGSFHQKPVDPNAYLGSIVSHLTQVSHNLQRQGPYY